MGCTWYSSCGFEAGVINFNLPSPSDYKIRDQSQKIFLALTVRVSMQIQAAQKMIIYVKEKLNKPGFKAANKKEGTFFTSGSKT